MVNDFDICMSKKELLSGGGEDLCYTIVAVAFTTLYYLIVAGSS